LAPNVEEDLAGEVLGATGVVHKLDDELEHAIVVPVI
jgi:hypothetical protein